MVKGVAAATTLVTMLASAFIAEAAIVPKTACPLTKAKKDFDLTKVL